MLLRLEIGVCGYTRVFSLVEACYVGGKQNSPKQLWPLVGPFEHPILIGWAFHFLHHFWVTELNGFMFLLKGLFKPKEFIYLSKCPSERHTGSLN